MAQKFNWGAALTTLGGGIGDYADTKRREMAMKMLRDQQVADRELARQQELDDLQAGYDRQDALNTQSQGMILPESMYLPGGEATMGGLGGMRMKPAVATLRDMYPQQRQSNRAAVPAPEQFVVIGTGGQPQIYSAAPDKIPAAVARIGGDDYSAMPAGVDEQGRKVYTLDQNYRRPVLPRATAGGGTRAPRPNEIQTKADQVTERAVGPLVDKVTASGERFYFGQGGISAGGDDLQNVVRPEVWQAVNAAATDSLNTPRWPIGSPVDALAGSVWQDVAPQYAEIPIPGGWQFREGDPSTKADDKFFKDGFGPFNENPKAIDFFKKYIVPQANQAKDSRLGWQALVNTAGNYGIDPNDLIPLMDKSRFPFLFKQAQAAAIEDDINEVFR